MQGMDPLDFSRAVQNQRNQAPRLPAMFYMNTVRNGAKSLEAGREIHDEVEFIRIMFPGDRTREVDRPAQDKDRANYPQEYALFKQAGEVAQSGTPLENLPFLNRAQVADLKFLKITTVESLAALSDLGIQSMGPGARELVARAKAFLDVAADSAAATRYASQVQTLELELRQKDETIKTLASRLDALEKLVDTATEPTPKGRGKAA